MKFHGLFISGTIISIRVVEVFKGSIEPGGLVDDHDDLEDEDGKSNEDETEDLSSSESSEETVVDISAAHEGGSCVGVDSNSHTNVSGSNGSGGSYDEGGGSVWEVGGFNVVGHLLPINGDTKDDSEDGGEDSEIQIFLSQEANSTL